MSFCDQSIATYQSRLKVLSGLLKKAEAHPDGDALLQARVVEDMHPLTTQIRFVTNIPGKALDRLGVRSFTSSDEELKSLARVNELVSLTATSLDSISPDELPAPEARMEFAIGDGAYHFAMSAEDYLREFSLPNFYFHLSTAYAILRVQGLEIGKADFVPYMMACMTKGPG